MGASAQWEWIDKDGRKVFSDRSPPPDIPDKSILKSPRSYSGPPPAQPAVQGASAPAAADAAAPAAGNGKDKALEEAKAKTDAAEDSKKKAEEERQAKVRAENCERAKRAKTSLTSGQLLGYTNEKGERGFMTDETRATELSRTEQIIASDCK
jgi:hypothetical protein